MSFLDGLLGRGKKPEKEKRAHSMPVRHMRGSKDLPRPDETLTLRAECYKCDYWCEYEIGANWREKYDKKESQWFLARGHVYLKSCGECKTIYCEDHSGSPRLMICPRCGSRLSRDAMWELLVSGRY
jgi:hypothetical protein